MGTQRIENPGDAFLPIVGQVAWSVRRGYGTFLTMEFGSPHLIIREPIVASSDASDRVKRNLAKRRVSIVGDCISGFNTVNGSLRPPNPDAVAPPVVANARDTSGDA